MNAKEAKKFLQTNSGTESNHQIRPEIWTRIYCKGYLEAHEKAGAVVEAAKEKHSLDEQTHGFVFGYPKSSCRMCKAIAKWEEE